MTAIKEYTYISARNVIGLLLIGSGAIPLWRYLLFYADVRYFRQLFEFGAFITFANTIVLDVIPIVLGIAIL
jgi:hypothetical protein